MSLFCPMKFVQYSVFNREFMRFFCSTTLLTWTRRRRSRPCRDAGRTRRFCHRDFDFDFQLVYERQRKPVRSSETRNSQQRQPIYQHELRNECIEIFCHPPDVQRAQEPAHHYMAAGEDVPREVCCHFRLDTLGRFGC